MSIVVSQPLNFRPDPVGRKPTALRQDLEATPQDGPNLYIGDKSTAFFPLVGQDRDADPWSVGSQEATPQDNGPNLYTGHKSTPVLFDSCPEYKTEGRRAARGWKSISGWIKEANKERSLLLINAELRQQPYTHELTIALAEVLTVDQIKAQWQKIYRVLHQQQVICYWRIEVTRQNLIHWHLTFVSDHHMNELKEAIKKAIPINHTIEHQPIDPDRQAGWIGYLLKAKTQVGSRKDISYHDRVIFAKDVHLRRNGTIGKFWVKSKAELNKIRIGRIKEWHAQQNSGYLADKPQLKEQVNRRASVAYEWAINDWRLTDEEREAVRLEDIANDLVTQCRKAGICDLEDNGIYAHQQRQTMTNTPRRKAGFEHYGGNQFRRFPGITPMD